MKHFFLVTLIAVLFSACDKVEDPVLENPNDTGGNELVWEFCPDVIPSEYVFPNFPAVTGTARNVLIEDFTGHTCANCPPAAVIAKQLEAAYPDRVFSVAVHAGPGGGFQAVSSSYPTDFTTEAGDTYVIFPDPDLFGNPGGCINRKEEGFLDGIFYFFEDWLVEVDNELALPTPINMSLESFYCPASNGLFVHSAVEVESAVEAADYRLIVYLIRKKVISPQANNGSESYIELYEHHNVLSDNINGTWGTVLPLDTLSIDNQLYLNYSYQLPDPVADTTYSADNLAIVAYVMDRNTQQIYQSKFIEIE